MVSSVKGKGNVGELSVEGKGDWTVCEEGNGLQQVNETAVVVVVVVVGVGWQ